MANTPQSKKAKGSRLEKEVASMYRHYDIDKDARRQVLSGGAYLKGDINKPNDYGWVDECKNQDKVKIWEFWAQTEEQAKGLQKPVLHFSGNYRPILTVMRVEDYFYLRQCEKQLEELLDARQKGLSKKG